MTQYASYRMSRSPVRDYPGTRNKSPLRDLSATRQTQIASSAQHKLN